MPTVNLHLDKNGEEIIVPIIPNKNSLGTKWFYEVVRSVAKFGGVMRPNEDDRVYNLSDPLTEEEYVSKFIELTETINKYQKKFPPVKPPLTQKLMNELHHEFELFTFLRDDKVIEVYSPEQLRLYSQEWCDAFIQLNLLIHRWEWRNSIPRIVANVERNRRVELKESDYKYWTNAWEPWDVALNYCITGKKIYDVFQDDDDIVWDENIRPQNLFAAAFVVYLWPWPYKVDPWVENKFYDWWKKHEENLKALGYQWWEEKNRIGWGIVWKLKNDYKEEYERCYGCTKILKVSYTLD